MNSSYESDAVIGDLGEKIVNGIAAAVRDTRSDLAMYRELRPAWVAEHSERGLANWIHDRMWVHLQQHLEHLPECAFVNDEPERRFRVADRYHFRAKRHDEYGSVATYSTQGALGFMEQQLTLEGMHEVRLLLGYIWEREERQIRDAVISLRDSKDNVIWLVTLAEPAATQQALTPLSPATPTIDGPSLPDVITGEEDTGTTAVGDDNQ
ncbi:hypothetical protein F0Q45_19370 [Mycobacterium simiae]|uniref:Uncharacterized protein n=1 Tax=Mycobacterium simiae TaxID=1784 RepID=A0A5B1BMN9_MYCSI|nr:hypothetical protein [Mycobacterium simiae]KAA1248673.1 hypothetical protein F0Q45_19370 [Mycobacterium simiae]